MFVLNSDETRILLTINHGQKGFIELDAATGNSLNSAGLSDLKPISSIYAVDSDYIYYSGELVSDSDFSVIGKLNVKTKTVIWSKKVGLGSSTLATGIL